MFCRRTKRLTSKQSIADRFCQAKWEDEEGRTKRVTEEEIKDTESDENKATVGRRE